MPCLRCMVVAAALVCPPVPALSSLQFAVCQGQCPVNSRCWLMTVCRCHYAGIPVTIGWIGGSISKDSGGLRPWPHLFKQWLALTFAHDCEHATSVPEQHEHHHKLKQQGYLATTLCNTSHVRLVDLSVFAVGTEFMDACMFGVSAMDATATGACAAPRMQSTLPLLPLHPGCKY